MPEISAERPEPYDPFGYATHEVFNQPQHPCLSPISPTKNKNQKPKKLQYRTGE